MASRGIDGRNTHQPMGSWSPTSTSGVHHLCGAVGTYLPTRPLSWTTPCNGVRQELRSVRAEVRQRPGEL